jgi:hypothetical protein
MVVKGTWYTGEGDVSKPETMVPIKGAAGGFMFHPAGYHHYDGSMDDNEVIVQLMGCLEHGSLHKQRVLW